MPDEAGDLPDLERRREDLYRELSQVGDFRRGSLNEVRRRCGKPNCACAQPGHPGHGPQYNLTRSESGGRLPVTCGRGRSWKRSGGKSAPGSGSGTWWAR